MVTSTETLSASSWNTVSLFYGIISCDSDYFGFDALPDAVKLINEFRIKTTMKSADPQKRSRREIETQSLSFSYYHSVGIWKALGIQSLTQRLELICLVGNDFVKKRTRTDVLRRCCIDIESKEKDTAQIIDESAKEDISLNSKQTQTAECNQSENEQNV